MGYEKPGWQEPIQDTDQPQEVDPRREERLALMDKMYELFPTLGPALNEALTEGSAEEAMAKLDGINQSLNRFSAGRKEVISFDNPVNGRKFDVVIIKDETKTGPFVKESAGYSVSVSYSNSGFEK